MLSQTCVSAHLIPSFIPASAPLSQSLPACVFLPFPPSQACVSTPLSAHPSHTLFPACVSTPIIPSLRPASPPLSYPLSGLRLHPSHNLFSSCVPPPSVYTLLPLHPLTASFQAAVMTSAISFLHATSPPISFPLSRPRSRLTAALTSFMLAWRVPRTRLLLLYQKA